MLSQPCHKLVLLQVRSHLLAVRFDRLELGGNDAAAHRDILVPIFHLAVDDASSGCMKLLRPGFRFDAGDVILPNSAPRHDDDAACRTFHQFGNERNPFHGIGLLAGSQDTVAAQLNQLLQCGKGIAANIKGAMTGDRQRFGRLDQPAHQRDIDIPVFRQATKDYAVHLQLLAQFDRRQV